MRDEEQPSTETRGNRGNLRKHHHNKHGLFGGMCGWKQCVASPERRGFRGETPGSHGFLRFPLFPRVSADRGLCATNRLAVPRECFARRFRCLERVRHAGRTTPRFHPHISPKTVYCLPCEIACSSRGHATYRATPSAAASQPTPLPWLSAGSRESASTQNSEEPDFVALREIAKSSTSNEKQIHRSGRRGTPRDHLCVHGVLGGEILASERRRERSECSATKSTEAGLRSDRADNSDQHPQM